MAVSFEVSRIFFGHFQATPVENVTMSETEICLSFRSLTERANPAKITIPNVSIGKIIYNLESSSTLVLYVMEKVAHSIRTEMQLGEDVALVDLKWILIQPSALTDDIKSELKKILCSYFVDEISEVEMDIMIKRITTVKKAKKVNGVMKEQLSIEKKSSRVAKEDKVDTVRVILLYPASGKGSITITIKDYEFLSCDEYLNDIIIDFYLKYLYHEVLKAKQREKTHIFSTFFYQALTEKSSRDSSARLSAAEKRHEGVKNWTKDVNIFQKDFIIVPVNMDMHWFLAMVCFPSLKKPEPMESSRKCTRSTNKTDTPIKRPCILVFDSLVGEHSRTVRNIRDYVNCEYAAKMQDTSKFRFDDKNMPSQSVRVPHQPNTVDCGLFLLQYVEQFYKDPIKSFNLPITGLDEWFDMNVAMGKRTEIANLIKKLMRQTNPTVSVDELPDIYLSN